MTKRQSTAQPRKSKSPAQAATRAFQKWESDCGIINAEQGRKLLGVSPMTYKALRDGAPVKRLVALAMAAVAAELPAFGEKKTLKVEAIKPRPWA